MPNNDAAKAKWIHIFHLLTVQCLLHCLLAYILYVGIPTIVAVILEQCLVRVCANAYHLTTTGRNGFKH